MEDADKRAVEQFIARQLEPILKARSAAIEAGGHPSAIYIGDIFIRQSELIRPSPMHTDTGFKVYGMRVIADGRVPSNQFYITYGDLR